MKAALQDYPGLSAPLAQICEATGVTASQAISDAAKSVDDCYRSVAQAKEDCMVLQVSLDGMKRESGVLLKR